MGNTETLKTIQQAKEADRKANGISTFEDFLHKLEDNHISKIDDLKFVEIQQYGNQFTFVKDGESLFSVEGERKLEWYIQKFIDKDKNLETNKEAQNAKIEIKDLKIKYTTTDIKEQSERLRREIEAKQEKERASIDLENIQWKTDRLIQFFEHELKESREISSFFNTKYDRVQKWLMKLQKAQIKNRLKDLKNIEKQLKKIEKEKTKFEQGKLTHEDIITQKREQSLRAYNAKLTELGEEAPDFITQKNAIILHEGTTTPFYEIKIHNFRDTERAEHSLKKINEELKKINISELSAARKQELEQDLSRLEKYLNTVLDQPNSFDPSKNPFVKEHLNAFNALLTICPTLKEFLFEWGKDNLNRTFDHLPTETPITGSGGKIESQEIYSNEQKKSEVAYWGWLDAFSKWWIAGMGSHWLDLTKMSDKQKKTWEWVGNIALTGWMIYVWWKMVSSAWKLLWGSAKDEKEKTQARQWLLGPTAIIFGSHALTGESPLNLIKWGEGTKWLANTIAGWIWWKKSWTESPTELKFGEWLTWVTAMFAGLEYDKVSAFLEEDSKGNMKVKENKYEDMIKFYENSSPKNAVAAEFLKWIGKKDKKNLVHLGLSAMWIKNLQTLNNAPHAKFSETAADAIVRLDEVSKRMREWNYDSINPDKMDLVENFIANKDSIDKLEALEARWDVFERDGDLEDKTGMADKIKEITKAQPEKEIALLRALNIFYSTMPEGNKKVEVSGTWPTIEFKTHENITKVNMETNAIEKLGTFTSALELFRVANLTNLIKKAAKGKQAQSENPFNVSVAGKDIEFDDAKVFSLEHDTTMVSGGWGGNLEKVSPTLEANKQKYCDYLNNNVTYLKAKKTA